jgi:hypothetical protein
MKVTLAVLADYANVSREGKLNILGIFDIIYAKAFPCVHNQMQLVIRFEADIGERGRQKSIEVQLIDEDAKQIMRLGGQMTIGEVKPGELFTTNQVLTLQNVLFEKPGTYRFDIFVDNQPQRDVLLKVLHLP